MIVSSLSEAREMFFLKDYKKGSYQRKKPKEKENIKELEEVLFREQNIVYMYTNKVNGKKYIGITCNEVERKKAHKRAETSFKFHKAIKKWGFDSFEYTVLHRNLSREEAGNLEKCYIASLNTSEDNYGYNMTLGGVGRTTTSFTLKDVGKMCSLYEQNYSLVDIGKRFHCHRTVIKRVLEQNNIKIQSERRKGRIEIDEEKLVKDYKNGKSLRALARKNNCALETVRKRLVENSIEIEVYRYKRYKKVNVDETKIIKEYIQGYSYEEISKKHKCSVAIIKRRLKSNGVKVIDRRQYNKPKHNMSK